MDNMNADRANSSRWARDWCGLMMSKISAMRLNFLMLLALPVLLMACGPSTSGEGLQPRFHSWGTPRRSVHTNDDSAALAEAAARRPRRLTRWASPWAHRRGRPIAATWMRRFSWKNSRTSSVPTVAVLPKTMPSLLENQIADGEVVLVFHDFPLSSIHPQAAAA